MVTLVKTMRVGVLVLGPLLTKYKKAKVFYLVCAIGTRPVDLHLFALKLVQRLNKDIYHQRSKRVNR